MRIGVVTTSYPRHAGDWAGNFVGEHVAAVRALGHTLEVVAAGPAGRPTAGHSVDTSYTVPVRRISSRLFYRGGAPDELVDARAWRDAALFGAQLTAELVRRAHRWDLIVAHWLAPSALAALPTRAPLLAIAHGGDIHTLRRLRLLAPALYALRARRARLVFVSDELLELARAAAPRLARWLDTAAIVQPMGVPLARFAALSRAPADPPQLAVVARLVPLKGVDVAIRALDHLRMPVRLVIAGDGPARGALEQLASPRVSFLGAVDETRRDHLLRECAALVVPSRVVAGGRSEGMPLVALEALAAGVPLVASAVGGLPSLAPAAALVPPDDPSALAAAIDRVLASPPPEALLRSAVAALDWSGVAMRLLCHAA